MRTAFLALGGIAAAVTVVALVLTDSLGIGAWQQNGISAPSTSAPSSPRQFVLPDDCASLVDQSIIDEWSARYGDAPLIGEMGSPLGGPRTPGRLCSYGSTGTAFPSLRVAVTVLSADNPRLDAEEALQAEGLQPTAEADGSTLYYSDTPGSDGATAEMILVTDAAMVSVQVAGTSAADGPAVLPLLPGWLTKVTDRLGLPTPITPTFRAPPASTEPTADSLQLPASCADVIGTRILPVWSPRFGSANPVAELSGRLRNPDTNESVLHCVYGSNEQARILSVDVAAIRPGTDDREQQESRLRSDGADEHALGDGILFLDPLKSDPVEVTLTLVTDTALISVASIGTEQGAVEVLPYLREWLDDVAARTGAAS